MGGCAPIRPYAFYRYRSPRRDQGISPTVSNASSPNNATQQNQAALKLRGLHNIKRRTGRPGKGVPTLSSAPSPNDAV